MKHAFVLGTLFFSVIIFTFSSGTIAAPVAGDIDGSGSVAATDVQLVINAALDLPVSYPTDVSHDGSTNAMDVQLVINAALELDIDSDEDGLCNAAEINLGTSPLLLTAA